MSGLLHSDVIRHLIEERIDREDAIEPMQKELAMLKELVALQKQIIVALLLLTLLLIIYAAT
jgi:hypothetical protein